MRLAPTLAVLGVVSTLLVPPAAGAAQHVLSGERVQAREARPGGQRAPSVRRANPIRVPDPAALRRAKDAAERRRAKRTSERGETGLRAAARFSPRPQVGVFGGLNQPGLGAADEGGCCAPPDTTGAIGPGHYVEMVNNLVAVYSRSGLGRISGPVDLGIFTAAPGGTALTDPQIQWDPQSRRWYYTAVAYDPNFTGANYLEYGYTKTTDPSSLGAGGWCRYNLPSGSIGSNDLFDDFPKLGHDNSHVLIGTNVFDEAGNFRTARIHSLPKPPSGTTCQPSPIATFFPQQSDWPLTSADGDEVFAPVPANNSDGSTAGYVVAADSPPPQGPSNRIMAWHVSGSTLVQDGNIPVAPYDVPATARQPLPGGPLDTLEAQLTMAVADADPSAGGQKAVWTQHTIDPGNGRVVMRWYELLPASHRVRQQGNISSSVNDVFNGAVSPATSGDFAGFDYNVSGPSLSPQIRARVRGPSLPLGRTGGELLLGSSSAPAQDFSCLPPNGPPCRWGDYAGASPDPSNAHVVWGSNQAVGNPSLTADAAWTSRNFAITDRPPSASFTFSSPTTARSVTFTSTSSDPDGGALSQSWDLDGNGSFGDATGSTARFRFRTARAHTVRLRVTDSEGLASVATRTLSVRDKTPPKVTLIVKKVFKIRSAIRRGVRFKVRSNEAGRIRARLVISRRTARRLHLVSRRYRKRTYTIGKGSARLRKAGTKRVKVKLTRRAKRALRKVGRGHRVRAQLQVRVRDLAGNSTLKKRRIRLRR